MALLTQCFICVMFMFSLAQGINFFSTPPSFYEGDKNVKIICNLADDAANTYHEMTIEKKTSDNKWSAVAEITATGTINKDINIVVTGYVGSGSESYLMITWPVAATSNFGTYRCEAVGKSPSAGHVLMKSGERLVSGTLRNTHNLFDLIRSRDKDIIDKVQQAVSRTVRQEAKEGQHFVKAAAARLQLLDALAKLQSLIEGSVVGNLTDLATRVGNLETSVHSLVEHHYHHNHPNPTPTAPKR